VTHDYGMRARRRRGPPIFLFAGLAVVAIGVAAVVALLLYQRQQGVAEAREWAITGPPCPTESASAYTANLEHAPMSFAFEGVAFAREFGHVSCNAIVNDGGKGSGTFPECQFTSADQVKVTTKRGDTYFYVRGKPATVAIHNDTPSCVLAAKFGGYGGPAADTAVSVGG
jgi:hypothetical protein